MVECKECHHYFVSIATVIVCLAATLLFLKTETEKPTVIKSICNSCFTLRSAILRKNKAGYYRNLEVPTWKIEQVPSKKVAGLILARGGSKGLPRKNLAIIRGKTLLARAIGKMKQINRFDEIWVSTDDAEIIKEAVKAGALVHARHPATALDVTPSLVAVQEFMARNLDIQIVALVQCTSPFLRPEWLLKAYNKMVYKGYDSVFSVTRQRKLRWKLNHDRTLSAMNFDPSKRPRRQDWQGELVETGMFYFATRQLIEGNRIQGEKIGYVEIPSNHSLEIDVQLDLIIAQSLAPLFDST